MKRKILAILLGLTFFPALSFAHDQRGWDRYDRRVYNDGRSAQPGDPGYYCHKHKRKTGKHDNGRKHCHSVYNDEHNSDGWRDYRDYSDRDRRNSRWGWFGN
ncbi:MAG: hypothetical protein FJ143_08145 [Deltaproteobacteria bacterium]|nr:hypothetical protein [Deltaproteobacteria bacterium]MBM4297695.1 hypothetical protein [Deltaproteobacteria bacterium]